MSHDAHPTATSDGANPTDGLDAGGPHDPTDASIERIEARTDGSRHVALFYERPDERLSTVVSFVERGLARNERVIYVIDDGARDTFVSALKEDGVDVEAALTSGQLTIHDVDETYLNDGRFDPEETLSFYADAIDAASDDYDGLRVSADVSWLGDDATDLDRWLTYESRVNELIEGRPCIALCQYDRRKLPETIVHDLVRTHPYLIFDGVACQNVYYTPPAVFLEGIEADREVDRMIGTLVDRTIARTDLSEQRHTLRRQNEITADSSRSFEEKLQALFDLGCERLGLELGGLASVDRETNHFEIEYASADHEHFQAGRSFRLSETYCEAVASNGQTVGVSNPEETAVEDVFATREFGVRAYLGTYVEVDGGPNRTFFFVSSEPRSEPFSRAERTFTRTLGQWVKYEIERKQREDRLTALNELNQAFQRVETASEAVECLVDHASTLRLPALAVGRYDPVDGSLRRASETDDGARICESLRPFAVGDGVGWSAFLSGERRRHGDASAAVAGSSDTDSAETSSIGDVLAVPLGDHGVLVAGIHEATDDGEIEFVETVASAATATLDRTAREQQLLARERTLTEQNETLTRLGRINTIIRNINKALVSATSRSEIEAATCEELTESGPYELAWIGAWNADTTAVTPVECAGDDAMFLDAIGTTDGEPYPLASRAALTRSVQIDNDLLTGAGDDAWRQEALNRGYHAAIALPLAYQETMYGVLTIIADLPGVFDDLERSVLAELSDTIAHAIDAVENRRSLVGTDVFELSFTVPSASFPFGEMVAELECTLVHEASVCLADGRLRWFFRIGDTDPDAVSAYADRLPVDDVELYPTCDSERVCQFAATVTDASLPAAVFDGGGQLHGLRLDSESASVIVHLATEADCRAFVEAFRRAYGGTELVGKRRRERNRQTAAEFRSVLAEDLTDRQRETLRTAYFSGYFEQPRSRTGQEIAESMGITQPTFAAHLRNAERKIYAELYGDDDS